MDIIQLLEVLKPAKDVVTVQIANDKDQWASVVDLLKAVIPAIVTGGVAWLAMSKSHQQYKENSNRQSEEFKLGIEQQLKTLKLNARLATDIELKKENCREVRVACIKYLSEANSIQGIRSNRAMFENLAKQYPDNTNYVNEFYNETAIFMQAKTNLSNHFLLLLSHLNEKGDADLHSAIVGVYDNFGINDSTTPSAAGDSTAACSNELRKYISRKQQEIIALTDSIDN
ncbi:hypothetical protein FH968_17565 [Buttiauxella sp. B2]|uniref:hypothetical protein n=1 Tax=Buttiauxella sp. B2 TaxID=2587812 RepID=UPI001121CA0C|nr:hypothetical protein [Buttiauxella sp. B2]TNV17868.1 hypothetical protein FH968_17565 [Buttiauxella sp. B2]